MGFIYKYVNNDIILYIGKTTNLKRRIGEHATEEKFQNIEFQIYYFKCANSVEMDAYEYFLINKYHPQYNIALNDNNKYIQGLIEPEWKLYSYKPKIKIPKETIININDYNHKNYLTIKEASTLRQVSPQSYYKRIKAGTVPMVLIEGKQCIPKDFVLQELNSENNTNNNKTILNNDYNIIYFLLDALEEQQQGAKNKYTQLIQRYFGVNIYE